jgi:hypothetical protein
MNRHARRAEASDRRRERRKRPLKSVESKTVFMLDEKAVELPARSDQPVILSSGLLSEGGRWIYVGHR